MTIQGIRTNVQALLESSELFTTVLPHPPKEDTNFGGFPSSCHYYDNTDPQYATVTQNRRVIQYTVELYMIQPKNVTPETEYQEAYDLIDSVIQLFDESIDLSSQTIPLARACDLMRPAPGEMQRVTTPEGDGLMCTIRLFCEADVSFR